MRPSPTSGRGLATARGLRVLVDAAGALVVHGEPGARPVATRGEVRHAYLLDATSTARLLGTDGSSAGALLLVAGSRPVLALRLAEWSPPAQVDDDVRHITSGATALAGALGLPLEPVPDAVLDGLRSRDVRAVEVRARPATVSPGRLVRLLAPVGALLAFLAWPTGGRPVAAVLTAVAVLLTAPVVLGVVRGRAEAQAQSVQPPQTGVDIAVRPAGRVPAGLLDAVVVVGPDEVFLRRGGACVWLPGQSQGGITQVVMEPEHVRLADADGRDYAELETALWCGSAQARDEMAAEFRAAGLTVLDAPIDTVLKHDMGDLATGRIKPSDLQTAAERGDPTVAAPFLGGFAAALSAGGALASSGWNLAVGGVLLVVALGLLTASAHAGLQRARRDRSAVRLVDAS